MNNLKKIKEQIFTQLNNIIEQKIEALQIAILSAKESRNNDTKSSMGDKYETGRAMIQMELDKYEMQLNKSEILQNELSKINLQNESNKIEFGSLVFTSQGNYFISIGLGKINVENEDYYCISLASPIGTLLYNKKANEKVQFQEKEFTINNIV